MDQELANIGLTIKRLRKSNGLTQGELGNHTGFSQGSISAYESGESEPGYIFLKKLKQLFGYDLLDDNIRNVIFEKTFDKERGKNIKEKSGPSIEPDQNLLTLIKNHIKTVELSLQELSSGLQRPLGPGTSVVPGSTQSLKSSDKKRTQTKPKGI